VTRHPRAQRQSTTAAFITALAALGLVLASCHPLINPYDPASAYYSGETEIYDESDYELPPISAWWSYAEHGPDQWIRFEIPDDGSYVESRATFEICVEFEEPVKPELADLCYVYVFYNHLGVSGDTDNPPYFQYLPDLYGPWFIPVGSSYFIQLPSGILPENNGTRALLQFYGPTGRLIDQRYFSWLHGDVNGDGEVPPLPSDDEDLVASLYGAVVNPAFPQTVRADVVPDGIIETADIDRFSDAFDPLRGNGISGVQVPDPSYYF